jgi:hypothetical protein
VPPITDRHASSRALAASAGLPVFASVNEYELALEGGTDLDAEAARMAAVAVAGTSSRTGPTGPPATGSP